MMKRRFDLLIFDWDGTLFDSVEWIVDCLQNAAVDCGLPAPEPDAARSVIGLGLLEALQTLFPGQPESRLEPLADRYRHHYLGKEVGPGDLFDDVPETLIEFRSRGYVLAIATGKGRQGLDRALRGTGIANLFSATRCADETASKPHPAMIHDLLTYLGSDKDRAVMIGDTTHDLQMAANAGIAGIGVDFGAHGRDRLNAFNPLVCVARVGDLLTIL